LKFHTIPKDKEVHKEYKRLIRNVNLKDSTRTRICGAHFQTLERMSGNQLPRIFPWLSLKSPKKRRIIFKHDIDTNKRRNLIFDPPEENKPPEVDLSEIREVVNDLVNNVDKLLQDDLVDVVDSSTPELQGKENDFEGSDQSATQVKMTQEIEELRKQVRCLQKELRQLKTKPKFDIDKHKDSDDHVAFFAGFPSYDVMLFCLSMRLRLWTIRERFGTKILCRCVHSF